MLRTRSERTGAVTNPRGRSTCSACAARSASCSSCHGHAGWAITICRSREVGRDRVEVDRARRFELQPAASGHARAEPGRAGVHEHRDAAARTRLPRAGTPRGRPGRTPPRSGAASAAQPEHPHRAFELGDRGIALQRVDGREPDERVRMVAHALPRRSRCVTGGSPVFVSASHARSTPRTSAARNTSAISCT